MRRVGISGTNWTGKTTTVKTFCNAHPDRSIDVVTLSDYVSRCPFPMGREQTPEATQWILEQLDDRLKQSNNAETQLFDRTPLDILAFTRYTFDRLGKTPDRNIMSAVSRQIERFALIFYAVPSEDWPVGVSPSPEELGFALLMDWYIRRAIRKVQVQIVVLPWAFDARAAVLRDHLAA